MYLEYFNWILRVLRLGSVQVAQYDRKRNTPSASLTPLFKKAGNLKWLFFIVR